MVGWLERRLPAQLLSPRYMEAIMFQRRSRKAIRRTMQPDCRRGPDPRAQVALPAGLQARNDPGSEQLMMFAAKPVRTLVALGLAAGLTLGAAACGTATAAGHLDQLQALAQSCPPEGTGLATYIGDDLSGSARDAAIESGRRAAIKAVATKTAVCGGHLRIDGFSSSVSASRVVFDGDLRPPGATQIAQLRKVDDLVKDTMPVIENGLQAAAAALQAFPGSDILGQFRLAEEYRQQLASTGPHRL